MNALPMNSLPIVTYPDAILREQSAPVTTFDTSLSELVDTLTQTLYSTSGIGLSAPQIGQSVQLFVMDLTEDHSTPVVFINPVIIKKTGFAVVKEECLSLPGVAANIIRAGQIRVAACNTAGEAFECELEGMSAVCVQHEVDHLQGKLFVDRLSRLRRFRLRKALRALEQSDTSLEIPHAV